VKLAYVMSRLPRVTETFVLHEMLALREQGFEVEVFPLNPGRGLVRHPDVERLDGHVHTHALVSARSLGALALWLVRAPVRTLSACLAALSGTLGGRRSLSRALAVLPKAAWIASRAQYLQIDHVHAHFANDPALVASIVGRLTRAPFSFTAHGSDLHVDPSGLDRVLEEASFAVTVSDDNRRFVARRFGVHLARRLSVLHCGIDLTRFTPVRRVAEGRLRIVCVASLRPVKGHEHLVEACRLLAQRGVDFECDLIGGGPAFAVVDDLIRRAGLGARVHLRGDQPRPRVLAALRTADVAVLTSVQDADGRREGIPFSLMEAMALELPVVASDLSGIPELVTHERDGLLVPPGDAAAVAAALERLARAPDLRRRLGRNGRERIVADFDLETNARELGRLVRGERAA
jgi:glycosyltransferase involved in cell wall biosynthesis